MKRERRKFSADFKAKVALEAIKERSTVLQISSKFKISPAQVTKWKHEFLE
ncbi:transposase IS3/IS911 family protein [Leadbetterella byssophila DSM 17132]|uniref:Transposase IS3/IS911 family protein n=1 Tax=Leadbetterella byssophila (strain DSM 17132 / JCM 16389 / KACC 11308 / NBRC 106382 / 4M15) TaxID=649349 RepID=E4RXP7_LEAB4|nr:transposase [Leadbetterella byssophila]ADQ18111.1 transposase IS3/IS911 family protein [Leadbetterella byssophila DSM 17132]